MGLPLILVPAGRSGGSSGSEERIVDIVWEESKSKRDERNLSPLLLSHQTCRITFYASQTVYRSAQYNLEARTNPQDTSSSTPSPDSNGSFKQAERTRRLDGSSTDQSRRYHGTR